MKILLAIPLLLALAGCPSTGIRTFGDSLGAAYLAADTVAKTAVELCGNTVSVDRGGECVDGGPITTTQMRGLKVSVGEALDLLDAARTLYQEGSADLAQDKLRTAQSLLRSLEPLIAGKQA